MDTTLIAMNIWSQCTPYTSFSDPYTSMCGVGDGNWEETFISHLKDSKDVPVEEYDSEEIGDEEMKETAIKTL